MRALSRSRPTSLHGTREAASSRSRCRASVTRVCARSPHASAPLLVFVDDDNVLAPDFLAAALELADAWPAIGVWGGQTVGEFETPPPVWARDYLGYLAVRTLDRDVWTNDPLDRRTIPVGAGMCVRREVAEKFAQVVASGDLRRLAFDRTGGNLSARTTGHCAYRARPRALDALFQNSACSISSRPSGSRSRISCGSWKTSRIRRHGWNFSRESAARQKPLRPPRAWLPASAHRRPLAPADARPPARRGKGAARDRRAFRSGRRGALGSGAASACAARVGRSSVTAGRFVYLLRESSDAGCERRGSAICHPPANPGNPCLPGHRRSRLRGS